MPPSPSQPSSTEGAPRPTSVQSRMASVQDNVRSLLRASIHSITPSIASSHGTPKLRIPVPSLPNRFRPQSRGDEPIPAPSEHRNSHSSDLYAAPTPARENASSPAPVPPPPTYLTRIVTPNSSYPGGQEGEQDDHSVTALVQQRTDRRHKKSWKRRRGDNGRHHRSSRRRDPETRALKQAVLLSGVLLAAVLALCTPHFTLLDYYKSWN